MYTNLTTELLRNFVAITDAGSMSKAADQICITQSALSLQMKRLADIVQAPIFQRHNRGMLLTDAGKTLLAYGKIMIELNDRAISAINGDAQTGPVRIGMIQDFADDLLSKVLVRLMKINPGAQIQIRIGSSSELISQLSGGPRDLVLCLGDPSDPGAVTAMQMAWLGNHQLFKEPMLPIALMESPAFFVMPRSRLWKLKSVVIESCWKRPASPYCVRRCWGAPRSPAALAGRPARISPPIMVWTWRSLGYPIAFIPPPTLVSSSNHWHTSSKAPYWRYQATTSSWICRCFNRAGLVDQNLFVFARGEAMTNPDEVAIIRTWYNTSLH